MDVYRIFLLAVALFVFLLDIIVVSAQTEEELRISMCVRCCRAFEEHKYALLHGQFLIEQCEDDGCRKAKNPNIDCEYTRKGWGEKMRSCNLGKDWYNNYSKGFARWEKANGDIIPYACIPRPGSNNDDISETFAPTFAPSVSPTTSAPTTSKPTISPTTSRPTTYEEFLEAQEAERKPNIIATAGGGIMVGVVVLGIISIFALVFVIRRSRSRRTALGRREQAPRRDQGSAPAHGFFDNSPGELSSYSGVMFTSSPAVAKIPDRKESRGPANFHQRNPAPTSLRVDNVNSKQNLWPSPNPGHPSPNHKLQDLRKADSMRPPSAFGPNSGRSRHANFNIHDMQPLAATGMHSRSSADSLSSGPSSIIPPPLGNVSWGSVPFREHSHSTESAASAGFSAPPGMMSERFYKNRNRVLSESEDDEFKNVEF
mmetsp:Transcript_3607/g.4844  ORF Transcript_3607/g.4844 Transcript_3607/m.4844 type:complete len:428 (-) Transcript_3607:927-2210(-)